MTTVPSDVPNRERLVAVRQIRPAPLSADRTVDRPEMLIPRVERREKEIVVVVAVGGGRVARSASRTSTQNAGREPRPAARPAGLVDRRVGADHHQHLRQRRPRRHLHRPGRGHRSRLRQHRQYSPPTSSTRSPWPPRPIGPTPPSSTLGSSSRSPIRTARRARSATTRWAC